jgi:hypothetical protein
METPDEKEQKFMTVDFNLMLLKWSWLSYLIVGLAAVCILLVSDQITRTDVAKSREVEIKLSTSAIEKVTMLKIEVDDLRKRLDELKTNVKLR